MNRITIAQLEAFYWTVNLGTVEAAARRLNLTQPSVSQRLKSLQLQFDQPLLGRLGRGLKISPYGQELLIRAEKILAELDQMQTEPDPAQLRGPVRVGLAEGLALVCLPKLIEMLHRRHPLLKLELSVGTSSTLEPQLTDRVLDIAFLVNPTEDDNFILAPMGTQETSWVAGRNWNLPDLVTPQILAGCAVITNEPGSINFRQVKGWFASTGITPLQHDVCNSVSMLAHIVTAGAAVGILPVKMAEPHVAAGTLRILRTDPLLAATPIHAKYPAQEFGPAARAVMLAAREVLQTLGYSEEIERSWI
tara:strand:+ start:5428 stop:6345 length:918 start_codon:yes stop_codon:yes gene_type:complete